MSTHELRPIFCPSWHRLDAPSVLQYRPTAFQDENTHYTSSPTMTTELPASVCAVELTDPVAVVDYPPQQHQPAEGVDLISRTKARHRRRLQERWGCKAYGHTYCFATLDGIHIPLSEDAIEAWVSAMHDSTATVLVPPKSIARLNRPHVQSDAASITSTISRNTVQYQRPFRLGNLSLTDLRSMHVRLRNSLSTTSIVSTTTASSGVPGVGYVSGKCVKWLGERILCAFVPLEIRRRRWIIRRLVKRIDKIPVEQCAVWLAKKEGKITRAVENLLELSSENYRADYRTTAIKQGVFIKEIIEASMFELSSETLTSLSSMTIKVFPLFLLADDAFGIENFAADLRETLLQDSEPAEKELLIAEIATQLCIELAYGAPSSWRDEGYWTLWYLYQTPCSKQHLRSLDASGVLMEDLTKRAFKTEELDISEQTAAVQFFAEYANDMPRFRHHLSGSAGIPFLIQHLAAIAAGAIGAPYSHTAVWSTCEALSYSSEFRWCILILAQMEDVCHTFVKLLSMNQRDFGTKTNPTGSWIAYCIVHILRNMSVLGVDHAVRDAVTDDLRQILPDIDENVRTELGDAAALRVRTWIMETWPYALQAGT